MKHILVRDWMSPNPVTVTSDTALPDAHALMNQRKIRRLPVVDHGELVGIVTLGDVRGASASEATTLSIYELNYLLTRLPVKQIMHSPVIVTTPETTIRDAAKLMLKNKVGGLPVVSDDKLVGIITESDIFRGVVADWETNDPSN